MPRPFSPTELETLTLKRGRKRAFKLAGEIPRTPLEFCGRYSQFPLSAAWVAVIMLLYAIAGVAADVVRTICGFDPPSKPRTYRSLLVLAGRRSGKSSVAVLIGLFEAIVRGVDHMKHLAVGQRGYVLILARTQRQSLETFRYGRAIIENNPELLALVDGEILESQTGGEIRFLNGVVWAVFPASKSSVRGFTVIFSLIEEAAFLGGTDDESANQDREIIAAVTYAMLAPTGAPIRRLVIISSPAAKSGAVYDLYSDHFGRPDAPTLVAHGATPIWNPSIDPDVLEAERKRDPRTFTREVLAEFVDAISAWCDASVIERAALGRTAVPLEYDPRCGYWAAGDFAFRRDRSVLAIGHKEERDNTTDRFVVDGVWSWTPTPDHPLDAQRVVEEMVRVLHQYRLTSLLGDQFAVVPLIGEFKRWNVRFRELTATSGSKFEHFTALREAFFSSRITLPNDETTLTEFRELEEHVTPSGNVRVSHPSRATAHDDHASAIAWLFAATRLYPITAGNSSSYTDPLAAREQDPSDDPFREYIEQRHGCVIS